MPPSPEDKKKQLEQYEIQLGECKQKFLERMAKPEHARYDIKNCEVISLLGKGGFGNVYQVKHDGVEMAVKVHKKSDSSPDKIQGVVREKNICCALRSELIVRALATFRDADNVYLYQELAIHGDLNDYMKSWGILDEDRARIFLAQMVCGLEYIHACNLLYRDMKPKNCLIFEKGRLKIADFGMSAVDTGHLNMYCGTRYYLAPEMFGGQAYTDAVDWWALGISMYEMLLGKKPFAQKGDKRDVAQQKVMQPLTGVDESSLSSEAKDLIKKLLEKDPAKRIGIRKPGVQDIKHHEWFSRVDFYHVIFEDVQVDEMGSPLNPGKSVAANLFKTIGPESDDPNHAAWKDY